MANVGPATLRDLERCGIRRVEDLKGRDATDLYKELCALTGTRQDPCVWDVFAAVIHEAETGEKTPWWHFTPIRKTTRPLS